MFYLIACSMVIVFGLYGKLTWWTSVLMLLLYVVLVLVVVIKDRMGEPANE